MSIVEEIKFDSFKDFYDAMGPTGELFGALQGFIFRGQSKESYELIPSAFRYSKDAQDEYNIDTLLKMVKEVSPDENDLDTELFQMLIEYALLQKFYRIANYSGLNVPCIKDFIFNANVNYIRNKFKEPGFYWIHKDIVELAALAQHYGIPTRLLDWSFDIYVALYFAARGACNKIDEYNNLDSNFCIWAINYDFLSIELEESIPLKFIVPTYRNNLNICAQKGILSYFEIDNKNIFNNGSPVKRNTASLDTLLSTYENMFSGEKILYKIILPYSCAKEIFIFLNEINYNAAKIFPGYWGVVKEMEEKKYFYL